jgi:hypothetical protein
MKPINSRQPTAELMMKANAFSIDDLQMNDDLQLSPAQKIKLKAKTDLIIILNAIGAIFCFIINFILFRIGQEYGQLFLLQTSFIILFGVCFFLTFWGLGINKKVKRGYGVKVVEGTPELSLTYSGTDNKIPVYNLKMGEVKFVLNEQTYYAFDGGDFRIYYFPIFRKEILSIEPID